MAASMLPLQSTSTNTLRTRMAFVKWFGLLLVIWAIVGWVRFSGLPSDPILPSLAPENDDERGTTNSLALDGSRELESSVPVLTPPAVKKHTDRVAVIIEDRPLGNLVPVMLHYHSVLGPLWPVILYTSTQTADELLRSAPFSRAVASAEIEIRHLPADTSFDTHAAVSAFLASPFLWTDLAPYKKVLLFQADSILCSASTARVDDFLDYDLLGAPIDARFGSGFNGGLSLRNRELVLRVLERWDLGEGEFEDQWLYARMRELDEDKELVGELGVRVNLPDEEIAGRFAAETIWMEGQRPLGFHQPHRWQGEHMEDIMRYCPEVGMIAGSSFFG
ncbi:hypothetical protein HD806DRAFT_16870 [Xylariaceae sp. AK1471]|nr:hypothetical protein HD806DRAFT_16870 [Xylariaceae sp. AK1471]